jgi:cyclomaltodextrin glucanotransferase
MPIWFWQEFNAEIQTHKPSVFIFGEWGFSKPWDTGSVNFTNHSGMSILDFGFCEAIRAALGKNDPQGFRLVQKIFDLDYLYYRATELITFIDNHDMPRFQSLNGDRGALKLAVSLILTSRGIPCLYYGTELYLHNDTNGGNDPYNRPMMDNWDTDSPLYKLLALFSKLRRLNPAISLGSQQQKYITADIYCYTRSYRDSRCFVAINRSNPTTINVESTDLEDGEYNCIVTRRSFEVKEGKLSGLFLDYQDVIVLSYIGDRVQGKTIVRVQLNGIKTKLGESIVVTGDCPELGNWNIDQAYALEYINDNTWFGEIPFNESAGKAITYKYAIRRENQRPVYENLVCRRWILVNQGIVKWQDIWTS